MTPFPDSTDTRTTNNVNDSLFKRAIELEFMKFDARQERRFLELSGTVRDQELAVMRWVMVAIGVVVFVIVVAFSARH
ncbi:MAG TPA: hypothetical protein VGL65_05765 [Gemmatimonadales bacterium]|jgi:hypothetical protein